MQFKELEEKFKANPNPTPEDRLEYANGLLTEGRYEDALEQFRSAAGQRKDPSTRATLGDAYLLLGQSPHAMREYLAALRRNPDHHDSRMGLGDVYRSYGKLKAAIGQY